MEPWAALRARRAHPCAGSQLPLAAGRAPRKAALAPLGEQNYCSYVFTETAVEEDKGYSGCRAHALAVMLGDYCVVTDRSRPQSPGSVIMRGG